MRKPDFENNLLRVLKKQKPARATMYELFLHDTYYERFAGHGWDKTSELSKMIMVIDAMTAAGYDYAPCFGSTFAFDKKDRIRASSISLNGNSSIWDWESYEKYVWPDPDNYDYSVVEKVREYLPEGMKLCILGPCGVLENVIQIVGYDNLCYMLYDEPELVEQIFQDVGSRLLKYYQNSLSSDTVGFISSNDDWGFNTQTFLSVEDMRKYVFPWHKKIVEAAHSFGVPAILHSCGNFERVIEDVINDMQFDARHSYQDNIMPVEDAYRSFNGRIAVLGGMDMNFLLTASPDEVYKRSRAIIELTDGCRGYALGSGNSIPRAVPFENFLAMSRAALEFDT